MLKKLAITLLAGAVLATTACGSSTQSAQSSPSVKPKATVGLTYIPNVQFSPFYLADGKGYFTKAGVDVTLRHHGANEGLFTALVAGQENFVVAGGDELVQARAQGMDLVAVSAYYHRFPVVLLTKTTSPVKTTADLKGRKIGVPGRYGESWFGLLVALKDAKLTEKDVTIVEIGYTQQAALTSGKVDVVVGFANNDAVQFEQAGVAVRQVPLVASGSVPLVGTSLITTGAYLKAHPDVVKKVVAAMLEGIQQAVSQPDSALAETAKQVPNLSDAKQAAAAKATLLATVPIWVDTTGKVSGKFDAKQWTDMVAFMKSQGLIAAAIDAAACWTNAHVAGS